MTKKLLKSVLLSLALATSLAPTAILAEEQSQQDNTSSVESISKLREEAKKEVYNEGKSQRVGSDVTGWVNVPEDFKEFTKYKEENEGRLLQYDRNNEDVVVTLEKLDAYPREKVAEFMKKATDLELHAKDKVFHVNSTLTPYFIEITKTKLPFADEAIRIQAKYGPNDNPDLSSQIVYYVFAPNDQKDQYYVVSVVSYITDDAFIKNQVEPVIKTWSPTK